MVKPIAEYLKSWGSITRCFTMTDLVYPLPPSFLKEGEKHCLYQAGQPKVMDRANTHYIALLHRFGISSPISICISDNVTIFVFSYNTRVIWFCFPKCSNSCHLS